MHRVLAPIVAFFALVSFPSAGRAQAIDAKTSQGVAATPQDRWEERPFALMGVIGFGTPVGGLGVVAEYSPSRWFTLNGGVGMSHGPQVAVTPRIQLPLSSAISFGIGGGVSAGKYVKEPAFCFDCELHVKSEWSRAFWGNFELSIDGRSRRGFSWRTFVGMGQLLSTTPDTCTENDKVVACSGAKPTQILYVGASMGYAFDL